MTIIPATMQHQSSPACARCLGPGRATSIRACWRRWRSRRSGISIRITCGSWTNCRRCCATCFARKNRMTMAISGTGSAGQEATVVNLVEPGDRVLVCVNGVFGGRLADMAERAGGEVTKIERPWGEVFTLAEVKEALARVKPRVVAIVLAETSTGAWQPIEEIAAAVRDAGAMLILDTVTALGGIPVEIDKWQIDAVYSRHAEVPELPAGARAGVVQRSGGREDSRAQAKGAELVSRRVADRQLLGRRPRLSSHGADQHDLRAARSAAAGARRRARSVLRRGIGEITKRCKAGLAALGIEYATQAGHELPQLNAVRDSRRRRRRGGPQGAAWSGSASRSAPGSARSKARSGGSG